jgi:hypothetical protein
VTLGPDIEQLYLHAEFTSDEYDEEHKLRSTCVEAPNAELPVIHGCDRAAFDFSYDGASKFRLLNQVVSLRQANIRSCQPSTDS